MKNETDKPNITRRQLLAATGLAGAGLLLRPVQLLSQTTSSKPAAMVRQLNPRKSRVIMAHGERVFVSGYANRRVLREMMEASVCELTEQPNFVKALRSLFKKDDVIGFKFNQSAAGELGISGPLADVLIKIFADAGFAYDKMMIIELDAGQEWDRIRKVPVAWTRQKYNFNSGSDHFAKVIEQVTAIVNIPFLKANTVAGMSGCLKNLAYGLLKHPAKFHKNGADPYIADICAMPLVRDKLRLNIVNALKLAIRSDLPVLDNRSILTYGKTLVSRDMVAADSVGLEILDTERKHLNLPPLAHAGGYLPQLISANRRGLGVYHPDLIELRDVNL